MNCFWCEKPCDEPTREHLIPVAMGDWEKYKHRFRKPSNVVTACASCNNTRGSVYGFAVFDRLIKIRRSTFLKLAKAGIFLQYYNWIRLEKAKLGVSYLELETSPLFLEIYGYHTVFML